MGAEKKWLFTLFLTTIFSILLLLLYSISVFSSPRLFPSLVQHGLHSPPAFAYYLFGGKGDKDQIFRLLLAVYHPRNRYLLQLGADASDEERYRLVLALKSVPAIRSFENVDVIGKPDRFSSMGSTHIAATLHAAAMLMKLDRGWDWFIALSALDYPLVTQDDMSHVFSSVRRDLNFIDHTSDLGWKEDQRVLPVVVDPGIYLARRTKIFHAMQKRLMPDAFKLLTVWYRVAGSPWVVLSRSFLEFCLFGWDNLPRTLLMYFNNVMLSEESYFHSVICNSPEFKNTTVNGDLRYMIWDSPPKTEPHFLNNSDYDQMAQSGAAFARQFQKDDPVLDMIDEKILKCGRNRAVPGAWCTGRRSWWVDPCSQWGDVNVLKPGPQAKKLEETILNLLDDWNSQSNQCT
ncbi:beta-glucuronosyltransferase GlcAT14A-like isoform X2 [Gossypium australe]|uniref:Beta-glucuronosyltransferase GlcAT14A-like isoform X2 n=1 Tax=Gossypium australe TaxID=47621 RepID=A0A5B6VA09_9ROSI|nr:beta-glucuronosyltransferase GlcAT14A-like isoform X2 [Gossypium australe]